MQSFTVPRKYSIMVPRVLKSFGMVPTTFNNTQDYSTTYIGKNSGLLKYEFTKTVDLEKIIQNLKSEGVTGISNIQEIKMTKQQEKLLENFIRKEVRKSLKENQFDDSKLRDAADRLSQFFRVENNRTKIYQLLKSTEFNSNGEPTSNVQELTRLLNSTSDVGTKNYIRVALTR